MSRRNVIVPPLIGNEEATHSIFVSTKEGLNSPIETETIEGVLEISLNPHEIGEISIQNLKLGELEGVVEGLEELMEVEAPNKIVVGGCWGH